MSQLPISKEKNSCTYILINNSCKTFKNENISLKVRFTAGEFLLEKLNDYVEKEDWEKIFHILVTQRILDILFPEWIETRAKFNEHLFEQYLFFIHKLLHATPKFKVFLKINYKAGIRQYSYSTKCVKEATLMAQLKANVIVRLLR